MSMTQEQGGSHTPLPWFVGCQNDALFIVAGRPPALNNDYPWHDAPRVAVAKVFGPSNHDCLPVNADANTAYIVRACNAFPELLEALEGLKRIAEAKGLRSYKHPWVQGAFADAEAAIAKAKAQPLPPVVEN